MKRIKVYLLTLCIILGMFQTVAYADDKPFEYVEDELVNDVKSLMTALSSINEDDVEYLMDTNVGYIKKACNVFYDYIKNDTLGEFTEFGDSSVEVSGRSVLVTVTAKYEKANLDVTITYKNIIGNITATDFESELINNIEKSLGERILDASLNTVIGLTTVFIMLYIISEIIGLFRFIPRLQEKYENRKKNKELKAMSAQEDVFTQIAVKENLVYDTELVAVITAAISASTNASADSFVVRSIKKSKRKYV